MTLVLGLVSLKSQCDGLSFIRALISSFILAYSLRARHGEMLPSWSHQPGEAFRKFFLMLNLSLLDFGPPVSFCPSGTSQDSAHLWRVKAGGHGSLCCPWFRVYGAVDRTGI